MLETVNDTIQSVLSITWPMLVISSVVLISMRLTYLIKNKEKFILYKELLRFSFILYILCLFQIVTFRDTVSWSTNNFIPFREILRYNMGSRLFFKNVIGNMMLFLPLGFFISLYLKTEKPKLVIILSFIISLSIEMVQLIIGRVFDIDDIILNVLGGYIGFLLYSFASKVGNKFPYILKNDLVLNAIALVFLIIIIMLI